MRKFKVSRWLQTLAGMAACFAGGSILSIGGEGPKASAFGPFGPEGARMREQLWVLPSGSPGANLRATVFRPDDGAPAPDGEAGARRPVVVINHGTSEATRLSVAMPVYYWLSRWFVDRGYIVVLPQRRGHGATGGDLVESRGDCADPDHRKSGEIAADDIEATVKFMNRQAFVAPASTIVVGISTGGWASLALASRNLPEVRGIVNFAGGRGGHAFGQPTRICAPDRLVDAAATFGAHTSIPSLWLYSSNDSYFGPQIATAMARAWNASGDKAELDILPPYGADGHSIADDRAGWDLWGSYLQAFLARHGDLRLAHQQRPPRT